ncbi:MAG TPA: hypothetical protein VGA53_00060 [Candidatus Paceibacterota bacterium]
MKYWLFSTITAAIPLVLLLIPFGDVLLWPGATSKFSFLLEILPPPVNQVILFGSYIASTYFLVRAYRDKKSRFFIPFVAWVLATLMFSLLGYALYLSYIGF